MSRASPKPSVDSLKKLSFPQLKDALKPLTIQETKNALDKVLTVQKLKDFLGSEDVLFTSGDHKPQLLDLATETIHPAAGNRESNEDNTKKPDVAGSTVDNAETANDAASDEGNDTGTQQRPTRSLKGSSKAPVTEIVTKTVTETRTTAETEGSNTNDEFERLRAEYNQLHAKDSFENEQEVKTKLALDVAQKKFVEQWKIKASESDLRGTLDEVKRLENLLQPKIHDSRGFPILTPLNDPSSLPYRVEWKDEQSRRAIICCGPPVASIWRVVPTSEARAYDNYTEAPEFSEGRLDDTTTSAEARQIVGVGFKYPIVVGASIDKVFEKRSTQSREDKIESLPDGTTAEAKAMMERPRRRHIHVIMSYLRDGKTIYKHAPITHWYSIAGYDQTKGLRKVLNRAKEEQDRWETMLKREYRATYEQLEIEGEELKLQGSRESTPEADRLEDRRDDTPTPKKTNKRVTDTEANNSNADDSNANHSNANNSNAGNSNAGNSNASNSNAGNSNANHSNANHSNTNNSNGDESDANNSNGNNSNGNNSNGNNSNGNNSNGTNSNETPLSAANLVQSIELPNT
ncbi:hypothetical protein V496_02912 [Pseudogymnoascus sp. VKM F-4515 (FW-2607)]|nr:hypothetical protein V496_02912 [Pseudogymnoascus sp. VKM F-4515 (FW-2607)]